MSCSLAGLVPALALALALAPLAAGCGTAGGTGGAPDSSTEGMGGSSAAGAPGSGGATGVGGGSGLGGAIGIGGRGAGGSTGGGSGGSTGTGGRGTGGGSGLGGQPGVLRIMPLGDSITAATCWRALLWQSLNTAGLTGRFDLVGSNTSNSDAAAGTCAPSNADANNEGHSSCLITEIINNVNAQTSRGCNTTLNALTPALAADNADVVLMHFGTNDVWNNIKAGPILAAFGTMVDSLRAVNPRVVVLVAQIIPMNVTASTCAGCSCANCAADIPTLNGMIATWAAGKSTSASPVIPVDQYTGFNATAGTDTVDGVHPNRSGSAKMAARWLSALQPLF